MYWTSNDLREILTKQRLFNFYCGRREGGKTTAARNYGIEEFIKDNTFQIAYIRRYKTEMQKSKRDLFTNLEKFGFDEIEQVKNVGSCTYLNGKPFCHYFALSTDARVRGVDIPNLRFIVFDEFLFDGAQFHYLKDEVEQFLSLYETIARPLDKARKRVPVLFISNTYSVVNPYFNFFNIRLKNGKYKDKSVYCEIGKVSKEEEEELKATEWGRLIHSTVYSEHAIENKFYMDDDYFILKNYNHSKAELIYIFRYKSEWFGAWANYEDGHLFISTKKDMNYPVKFNFTASDMKPNEITQQTFKSTYQGRFTRMLYNAGGVFYENLKVKSMFYEIARRCGL